MSQPELGLATKNSTDNTSIVKKLDTEVLSVINSSQIEGFEKAFQVANAIAKIKELLTTEYMKPIMALQGNVLGFKTDKDLAQGGAKGNGYSEEVVKNCLIEAVLTGVQPVGNQFNIIAGNSYITKEGLGYLLDNVAGLEYSITSELPRINTEKTSAAIVMNLKWKINNQEHEQKLELPIRMNSFMGTDAVIGKGTRKARKWLYEKIKGIEISDGDITDLERGKDYQVLDPKDKGAAATDATLKAIKQQGEKAKE